MNKLKTINITRFGIKKVILSIAFALVSHAAYSQSEQDVISDLKQKFFNYTELVPREEVFIHTDREAYIAGEELFFTVYVLDRQKFSPSFSSRIAYVEIVNANQVPLVQKKILIDKGIGRGSLAISDTLDTGILTIRAYTNWMKNFLPENSFVKDIPVYNLLHGGKHEAKKVLKYAAVRDHPINKIWNTGITISVDHSVMDNLEMHIDLNDKFRSENSFFCIFIQTHGNLNYIGSQRIHDTTETITIPKSLLNEGINQVTLFNERGVPVAEKFMYTPFSEDNRLTIQSADRYTLRDLITLKLDLDNGNSPVSGSSRLSVSVAPFENEDAVGMSDYMILGSEFGIQLEDVKRGKRISELSAATIDSMLSNLSSNWIDWHAIISGNLPKFSHPVENEYHYLEGKINTGDEKIPDTATYILLCSPGKDAIFRYVRTDHKGNFSLPLPIDGGLKDFIIMPDKVSYPSGIVMEASFPSLPDIETADMVSIEVPSYIPKWNVNYQVRKLYGIRDTVDKESAIDLSPQRVRFYGKPDFELIMADYISLPLMEEVFFELLPHVSLRKIGTGHEIVITDRIDNQRYVAIPCLMIDGVIIKDPELIIDLDPELVEKIDVINGKYVVGNYTFTGLINVITKTGDFNSIPLPGYMIRLPGKVFDPVTVFYSPDYTASEMKNIRIPDYRNTLYWNPMVQTDLNGKAIITFWSADNASDYVISVQGITEDGKLISVKKNIEVVNYKQR